MNTVTFPSQGGIDRRRFLKGLALGGVVAGTGLWRLPVHAANPELPLLQRHTTPLELRIGQSSVNFTGRMRPAITVNNSLPGPVLRWRQGDTVQIHVTNTLPDVMTSIHWHGIVLPSNMDGVPGMSFDGIAPGEHYLYRFQLHQSGTYWYHSHAMFQEQAGLYGALIIDPLEPPPYRADREHILLFSDWTDLDPAALFRRLKKMSSYDNTYQRTVRDFFHDIRRDGLRTTLADRRMWGRMRMTPTDLSDVNAHTYTYLLNGTTPAGDWTGLFRPGEKVLLRLINGSAMTYFDVRIPGLKLTVVAVDGQYVHQVTVDELRIALAETYDVLIQPHGQDAFAIFAQDMGRTGYACGTLAVRPGLHAPLPALDPRPRLTMQDMGHRMTHGQHESRASEMADMPGMTHPGRLGDHASHANQPPAQTPHGSHSLPADRTAPRHPASEQNNPLVDMHVDAPQPRLNDPGIGLRDNGRHVLTYADLHSLFDDPDGREPGREIELHLTGHMEKFAWSFDGIPFASAQPLRLNYGERVRIVLVNDTMMAHPIHLHGLWSDLEDANAAFQVRKHTIDMPPGTRRSYRVRADALGRWAYHCHMLYHMESGMMREVQVRP
ncbi:copper resistance system multicopper oxidase [Xylella fastidiosa subsp. multiplex]|uniref:copper resistance system multicopper oxidase n=1 Tax=Xylella fastidiosa TaxID=2371 RepID=UPI00004596B0|nr:copper resistance system multicopper oxidase [Xylella fastidiosa]KAJ4853937.1 copper resistance system multicopper oxidase [Xylella fastidiosa subsp. multiplex]MDC6411049.1 copper resistance system multicopper oxidase [Xylella fastidiosa subsp. multiplex]MDC6414407.1 copper resistance system multicopper oxidase [Xylella fastidiosa subsp. multiplex]MDC6417642.1 copper resistance system multicopper oxidase [Xylella fastidiosa subsp. multiplex]MDD0860919.1 copper resistance system multicopper 